MLSIGPKKLYDDKLSENYLPILFNIDHDCKVFRLQVTYDSLSFNGIKYLPRRNKSMCIPTQQRHTTMEIKGIYAFSCFTVQDVFKHKINKEIKPQ